MSSSWFKFNPSIALPFTPRVGSFDFLPLSTSSRPTSPDSFLDHHDELKRFGRGSAGGGLRFANLWMVTSPVIVLGLLLALAVRRGPTTPAILEPYLCTPRSTFSSLAGVCAAGAEKPPAEVFRAEVDKFQVGMDRALTSAQCDEVFPGLFREVDRTRDYFKARGGVNIADLDAAEVKGQARAMIYNNRLYVKSYADLQQGTRTKATLAAINEALVTSLEPLPDVEFVLQTGDTGVVSGAPWVLGRQEDEEGLTLMPDYGFFAWPEPGVGSFIQVQDKTLLYESQLSWKDKIPKLFWKGALMVPIRKELITIASEYPWGAVTDIDWSDQNQVVSELLTPEQHCQFKYLGHAEGWAYSGRLKYLQQCRSVVVAHKMQYIQHFHHLFNSDPTSPDQNIVISPGRNFERLPEVMQELLDDDARAERIANNSFNFFRHWLSPSATNCVWRRLIQRWAEVQNFEPVLRQDETSYESFILLGKTKWIPY